MTSDSLTEKELEELLMGKANSASKRRIIETVVVWIIIDYLLVLAFFVLVPRETQIYAFGDSIFLTSFFVSLIVLLSLFVMNFAVGTGSGFSNAALVFVKETLEVEFQERLRMWDTSWGMAGPMIVAIFSLILYFIFG